MAFLIGGANSAADTGYDIDNSCRFNDGDSPYLHITPSAGNRKTWTWSVWIKIGVPGVKYGLFACEYGTTAGNSDRQTLRLTSSGELEFTGQGSNLKTSNLLRDHSAWYHIVFRQDTTQSTDTNRMRIYINGTEASYASSNYPDQNDDLGINSAEQHNIGAEVSSPASGHTEQNFFDGYWAEMYFVDGSSLAPSSFGETDEDSGIWKPKDAKDDLTFGDEGFYLEFKESGVGTASSSTIGADTSGNDNHFTSSGLATTDQCTDSPTNNFATLNPLIVPSDDNAPTLSEGNCKVATSDNGSYGGLSTIGVSAGKWYAEFKYITASADVRAVVAVARDLDPFNTSDDSLGQDSKSLSYRSVDGNSYNNNSTASYGDTWAANDIIGIALDLDNSKVYFSKNGTWQNSGDPTSGATGTGALTASLSAGEFHFIGCGDVTGSYSETLSVNFGNPPYANSSSVADANGYGAFEYAPPSGYYALCSKNLAEFGG